MPLSVTAERLLKAMEAKRVSKGRLQRDTPIDRKQLNGLLDGSGGLGRKKAEQLGRALGVPAAWLMGIDDETQAFAVSEAPSPYAARIGGWFEDLPDEVQETIYVLGVCLSDASERRRLATSARRVLRRRGHDIPASEGTAHTRPAGATRAGKKKASGR